METIFGTVLTYLMIPRPASLKLSTVSSEDAEIFVAGVPRVDPGVPKYIRHSCASQSPENHPKHIIYVRGQM